MIHKCEACGCEFAITEAVRSRDRLFKKSWPWRSFVYKLDEYFALYCPQCKARQFADEIRMFGVFNRKTAKLGLPLLFIGILAFVLLLDRFGI